MNCTATLGGQPSPGWSPRKGMEFHVRRGPRILAYLLLAVAAAAPGARASERGVPLTTTELRKLEPLTETDTIRPTGVLREFTLVAKPGAWELVEGVRVNVWAYNGQVPGPTLRVNEGDTVRVTLVNELDETTSIHWHGGHVPNDMDGVPPFTQPAVRPGERFTYEFTAWHAGTYMYHTHQNSIKQTDMGLYGPLIIDPQNPSRQPRFDREYTLMISGWIVNQGDDAGEAAESDMHGMPGMNSSSMNMGYNYWTLNGKAFPDTAPLVVSEGERVRIRLINISNLSHPMHLHGHDFRVIAIDGHPVSRPEVQNTVDVEPGRTLDIEFIADNPGLWVFHCHELHHTANGEKEPGGLIAVVRYEGYSAPNPELAQTPPAPASEQGADPHGH